MTKSNVTAKGQSIHPLHALIVLGLGTALLWSYWPTVGDMVNTWSTEAEYSHGFLVPLFAVILLYYPLVVKRMGNSALGSEAGLLQAAAYSVVQSLRDITFRINWWGLVVIGFSVAMRAAGTRYSFEWLEQVSVLPMLAGLVLLLGGWPALRWAGPAIAYLIFMVPLPWKVKMMLSSPLQTVASFITTYTLQTLGFPALREGNIIVVGDFRVGVIDACSGLSMLMVFFALSTAVAMVINRPLGDRIFLFLSAIPIAVASNVLRIIVTVLLSLWVGQEVGFKFFHVAGGWFMMPVALIFMWLELKLISLVLVEPRDEVRDYHHPSADKVAQAGGLAGAAPASVR